MQLARPSLLLLSACSASAVETVAPPAASVRERLEQRATLQVGSDAGAGAITLERYVAGVGWEPTRVELGVDGGELIVSADTTDELTLEGLQLSFAPFDIPPGVFGGDHAQLADVRVELEAPRRVRAVWTTDDEAHLATTLDLRLAWRLVLDGTSAPLGAPELPDVPVVLVLTGDGEHVTAALRAQAPGELWSWASLLRLRALQLTAVAQL